MTRMKKRSELPKSSLPENRARNGLNKLRDDELLSFVLGSGVKGVNVKEVSTRLIKKFGQEILNASVDELASVKGVGPMKATRIASAFEFFRRFSNGLSNQPILTAQDVSKVCADLAFEKQECLGFLSLDSRSHLLSRNNLYKGTQSLVVADPKHIFKEALQEKAHSIIIFHNHPDGDARPSDADIQIAERLAAVGNTLNLHVVDFIIISKSNWFSLLGNRLKEENPGYARQGFDQLTLSGILIYDADKQNKHTYKINGDGNNSKEHSENSLRFIDLFCGIGGFRIAFEKSGGKCVFSCDWDKYSRTTYYSNFKEMPHGDINQIDISKIPKFDILCAGFPCQPFSIAGVSKKISLGRKHGFQDEKQGNLFFKIVEILSHHKPEAFILENVKNLKSHDNGRTFEIIYNTLTEELGYTVNYKVIDAKFVVPQHRERIFLVGFKNKIHFEFPEFPKNIPKLGTILEKEPNPKYTLSDHLWKYLRDYAKKHKEAGNGFGFGLCNTNDIARTLSARYHKDGSEILIDQGPTKNPRRLTPRECARIMGYPDTFKLVVSDTQAYRQFGNSVVVPVVQKLSESIISILKHQINS